MGHSVETLVLTYAGVPESDETLGNQRISPALAGPKNGPFCRAAPDTETGRAATAGDAA
jgi:hypothetical protein